LTDQQLTADCAVKPATLQIRRAFSSDDRESCMRIRMEVFVDEQKVSRDEEIDGLDDISFHYVAVDGLAAVATARLIPRGGTAKIGRVAVSRSVRGRGIGLALMRYVLRDAAGVGFTEAVLDSQTYAMPFYTRLGFVAEGDEFLDAGIRHFRMRRALDRRERAL
jgi:predicted GNAT family N-acyltransferase